MSIQSLIKGRRNKRFEKPEVKTVLKNTRVATEILVPRIIERLIPGIERGLKDKIGSLAKEVGAELVEELKPEIISNVTEVVEDEVQNLVKNVKKGDTGDVGAQGLQGAIGSPGNDGKAGRDGKDGKEGKGGKQGLQGYRGDAGKEGKKGEKGADGSPDKPLEIAVKLNTLTEAVEPEVIKGFRKLIRGLQKSIQDRKGGGGMGNVVCNNFSGDGTVGQIFTLDYKVASNGNALIFIYQGQVLRNNVHFTLLGKVITMTAGNVPVAGTNLMAWYIRT